MCRDVFIKKGDKLERVMEEEEMKEMENKGGKKGLWEVNIGVLGKGKNILLAEKRDGW